MRAQSLLEFAILSPILLLLIFGVIDLGRGFYFQTQTTDAARDGARVLVGYGYNAESSPADTDSGSTCTEDTTCDTDDSIGPGFGTVCEQIQRDLANVQFATPACVQMSGPPNTTPPQYVACDGDADGDGDSTSDDPTTEPGCDYTAPPANEAQAFIYCGTSGDCASPGGGNEGGAGGWQASCDAGTPGHTCVTVEVVYTFSFLTIGIQNIAGPSFTIQDAAEMSTLW